MAVDNEQNNKTEVDNGNVNIKLKSKRKISIKSNLN
jgi:hypothetical protein